MQLRGLGPKIGLGYLLLFTVMAFAIGITFLQVKELEQISDGIHQVRVPTSNASVKIKTGVHRSLAALQGYAHSQDEKFKRDRAFAWAVDINRPLQLLQSLKQASDDKSLKESIEKLHEKLARYENLQSNIQDQIDTGSITSANAQMVEALLPATSELTSLLDHIIDVQDNSMDRAFSDIALNFSNLKFTEATLLVVGFVSSLLLVIFYTGIVVTPIRTAVEVANQIASGNLNADIDLKGSTEVETLGQSLSRMMASLREKTEQNIKEQWLKTELSKLTSLAQGIHSIRTLTQTLISELATTLGAGQAVFYVGDEKDPDLFRLTGTYAFQERKHLANEIRTGEGLIGQCALEKKAIILADLPEDYITISSGLGTKAATHIFVVPILFEEQVIGIIEVATFHRLSADQEELLKQISANLGVVIDSVQGRERTERLLEETQRQASILQEQQDKLKKANEEMEKQTLALKQSEEELKQQSEELRATNEELEEKTEHLEEQKASIEQQNQEIEKSKQALEIKATELEQASQYKSEFLANMSHELRTPLNSLLILARSLSENPDGNLTEEQIESAKVIYSGGEDLLELINDILDLSKVEAGKMSVNIDEVELQDILASMERQFKHVAKHKNLNFVVEVEDGVPMQIETDSQRCQQILKNLLSNAMKFTKKEGSVTLKLHQLDANVKLYDQAFDATDFIAFSVIDSGIGISKEKQQAIFEAFTQADGSTSRDYGGTGLGLAISKELSKLLEGEIHVRSEPGQGSTFTLYLPRKGAKGSMQASVSANQSVAINDDAPDEFDMEEINHLPMKSCVEDDSESIAPSEKSLLIVEDDKRFARILVDLARKKGFKALSAGDAKQGLRMALSFHPEAILLDIDLPEIDGDKLLRKLKQLPHTKNVPVHIISARDEVDISGRHEAIGYLTKPASREALDGVFSKFGSLSLSNMRRVLVIEDDPNNQHAIKHLLAGEEVETTIHDNGEDAHEALKQSHFDCVIMDLSLPDMTGFELIERLNADTELKIPPVIVYTARELSMDEHRFLSEHSSSIVVKGNDSPQRLLDETSLFLHQLQEVPDAKPEPKPAVAQSNARAKLAAKKPGASAAPSSPSGLEGKKVLLVDDDLRNTFALSGVLRKAGMNVIMADNGQLAIEKLEKEKGIEVVLMDAMMPVMDGYEATKKIRGKADFKDIPIIALTANAMPEDKDRAMNAGANDYLTKPVDIDKLMSMLRVWLCPA